MRSSLPAAMAVAVILVSTVSPLWATDRPFYSAEKLLRLCRSEAPTARARCRGYIVGAADAMHGGHAVCMPAAMKTEDLVNLVLGRLVHQDGPAGRRAETAIHKVLTDAFPAPPCM